MQEDCIIYGWSYIGPPPHTQHIPPILLYFSPAILLCQGPELHQSPRLNLLSLPLSVYRQEAF